MSHPRAMAKWKAEDVPGPPLRPTRSSQDTRVYYHKHSLLHHLRRICPEESAQFLDNSTFTFWNATSDDGSRQYRSLEIGRVFPMIPAQGAHGGERLFVSDRGAYDSNLPELVPYTDRGNLQHSIVEANGFVPTGVFDNFRRWDGHQTFNPRLDDPLVISLIQFIFIIRDFRRYYSYSTPHAAPPHVHLGTLVEALRRAAFRSTPATCGPYPPMTGTSGLGLPHLQVSPHTRTPLLDPRMDPRLAANVALIGSGSTAKTFPMAILDRMDDGHGADVSITNSTWPNGFNRFHLVPAHGIVSDEATGTETITDGPTPDRPMLYESIPGGNGNSSEFSPYTPQDDDWAQESDN